MKRVLIVDDDPSIHLIVTAALERAGGMQITFAHDGEHALSRIHAVRPDLILLDIHMPGIQGDDVMWEIRKDPQLRDTPVVFVTGESSAADLDYKRFGAKGLITKPFDPERLAAEISAFLPLEPAGASIASSRAEVDPEEAAERQREGFLRRALKEVAWLEGRVQGKLDVDAAKRIVALWQRRAGEQGHVGIADVAQRLEALLAGGAPRVHEFTPLLQEAAEAVRNAQRTEKWRLLDAEIESDSEELPLAVDDETGDAPEEDEDRSQEDGDRSQEVERPFTAAPRQAPAEIHVVVADDDPTIQTLVEATVSALGIVCHCASSGVEAVELLHEFHPQAAILDVNMPEMDGFEVLAVMRSNDALADTPVIMLTALRQEADIVRGFRLGADDYVVKPFSPMELSARLERLLRPRRGQGGGPCQVAAG